MARPKYIVVHHQTSIGANGFKLQKKLDQHIFEVIHVYHNGRNDKKDVTIFTNFTDAENYYNQLLAEVKIKISETSPAIHHQLITKII